MAASHRRIRADRWINKLGDAFGIPTGPRLCCWQRWHTFSSCNHLLVAQLALNNLDLSVFIQILKFGF